MTETSAEGEGIKNKKKKTGQLPIVAFCLVSLDSDKHQSSAECKLVKGIIPTGCSNTTNVSQSQASTPATPADDITGEPDHR